MSIKSRKSGREDKAAKRWDRVFKYMDDKPLKFEEIDDLVDAVFDLTEDELDEILADVDDKMRSEGRFDELAAIHEASRLAKKIVEKNQDGY